MSGFSLKEKVPPKIATNSDPGPIFYVLFGNRSAICSSRFDVRDERSAAISTNVGSYLTMAITSKVFKTRPKSTY